MAERSNASALAQSAAVRLRACSHCSGSGREPAPLSLDFSRSGERRGELTRLSERTGRSVSTLSRILNGTMIPSLQNVVLIAEALEVSESALIHYPPIWHRVLQELSD